MKDWYSSKTFSHVKQKKELSNKTTYCVESNNEMSDKRYLAPNETKLSQMNQAGNIKGAYTVVQRNTENLKLPAAWYYRSERDG